MHGGAQTQAIHFWGFFMHDVTQAIHFFCGCLQKRATTCSLEVGNLVLAAAKQIGPRCSQAFARLTDVRQAGLVSGGYPDSYLLDLGLLRCWSCEVGSKGVRKIESAISKKRRKRTHLRDLGYIYILNTQLNWKSRLVAPSKFLWSSVISWLQRTNNQTYDIYFIAICRDRVVE